MSGEMVEDHWGRFRVKDLREECRRCGIQSTGNKTQLIDRLCHLDENGNNNEPSEQIRLPLDERQEKLRAKYGAQTVADLKTLLKGKNASLRGKKSDLVDRLVFYDLNSNFKMTTADEGDPLADPLSVPEASKFKDKHAQCPLPPFTRQDIELYLSQFNKHIGKADGMYSEGFLIYVRFSNEDNHTFIYGRTYAEMRKSSQYNGYCKLAADGEVVGCTCECTHGRSSGEAHCKHVAVVLLGVAHVKQDGVVTTEQACTQQLQTFHQPKRKFRGTPLKARDLKITVKRNSDVLDSSVLDTIQERTDMSDAEYQSYFRNLIINSGFNMNMPLKHLFFPANPYGVYLDHTYSKHSTADILLNALKLVSIISPEIQEIAQATVDQSRSQQWHFYRMPRLTASKFYDILHSTDPAKKASTILTMLKFRSKATNHGIKFEPIAIQEYKRQNPAAIVTQTGFLIMESHPFIEVTADILVDEGEVKCPYTTRKHPVGPSQQPYLKWSKDGQKMKVKKKHYYYQIQGQLMVTGRQYCDFVVYTLGPQGQGDMKTIRIQRKANFISLILLDLVDFYDKYFKEAILNKFLWRDYNNFSF